MINPFWIGQNKFYRHQNSNRSFVDDNTTNEEDQRILDTKPHYFLSQKLTIIIDFLLCCLGNNRRSFSRLNWIFAGICQICPCLSFDFWETHTQLTNYSSKENPKSQQTTKQTSILFHVKVAPKNIIYTNSKRWRCLIWIWDYFSLPTSALSRISLANMVLLAALSKAKDFVVWSWTYLWALWFLLVSYLLRK